MQLELVLHLRPEAAGMKPRDEFAVEGLHPVRITIDPGMDAIPATSAQLVNTLPAVLRDAGGLKTVKDLPAAAAWSDLETVLLR
jgi:4-hydroxy-tetrahydrodipicolinate reductase